MDLTFANKAMQPITGFAIQLNKNSFGITPTTPLNVQAPLAPNQSIEVSLALSTTGPVQRMDPLTNLQVQWIPKTAQITQETSFKKAQLIQWTPEGWMLRVWSEGFRDIWLLLHCHQTHLYCKVATTPHCVQLVPQLWNLEFVQMNSISNCAVVSVLWLAVFWQGNGWTGCN